MTTGQESLRTRAVLDAHPPTAEPRRLLNRELSWLSFDERVLGLARAERVPPLERVDALRVVANNLDEFFQVRVAGLMEQVDSAPTATSVDGATPAEQLRAVRAHAGALASQASRVFATEVRPALAVAGIDVVDVEDLASRDLVWLEEWFELRVYPALTPLAVGPAHPFPSISSLSLNLAAIVRSPHDAVRFARVKVPPSMPRFVALPGGARFVPIEQVIGAHLLRLFPGQEIVDHDVFRVTRNADFDVAVEDVEDLLQAVETHIDRRRFGRAVRLEVAATMPDSMVSVLADALDVRSSAVDRIDGLLDLSGLGQLHDLVRPDLKYAKSPATVPAALAAGTRSVFAALREGDVLVQHPYDSFSRSVQAFVDQAARDPDVVIIKITLYRTSGPGSPLVRSLRRAAQSGKQVTVLIELTARFDEESNIHWTRVLREAGAQVVHGTPGRKTHTKTALVVRREGPRLARYAHVGTGNYNDQTALLYEDIGMLTADPAIAADLTELFNVMVGHGHQRPYRRIITAPQDFRGALLARIAAEADAPDGRVRMKVNHLIDEELIEALYAASSRGTPVDLVVRGICGLRGGVEGLSERISVRSIIGRHLEHSRIYAFGPDERVDMWIGSGDLMPRNLDGRVETLVPITDPRHVDQLLELFEILLADDVLSWEQLPDGAWERVPTTLGIDSHVVLAQRALARARGWTSHWADASPVEHVAVG